MIPGTRNVKRKAQIAKVLAKHGFGFLVEKLGLGRFVPFHWGILGHPKRKERYSAPEHLRMAFEELGPTFIKLGQILSTRPDLVPAEYIEELSKLQDRIPPCDPDKIVSVIEEELGKPVGELFLEFDREPIASASIGQVHRAVLRSGDRVVIKVQKPGVEKQIKQDLEILEELLNTLVQHWELARQWDIEGFFEEFAYILKNELDYEREGRNAETFRKNFLKDRNVYIPKVYWEYTTAKVLVLEELEGAKFTELEKIRNLGYDPKKLAYEGAQVYMNMFLRDGFFHGDPHPGNFFILKDGRIGLVDFGMVGTLDDRMRVNLIQLIYGITKGDMVLVMDALYDLGVRGETKKEVLLRRELEVLFSYYFLKPIGEIKLSKVVNELFRLTYRYRINLPSDLFLLLKTIGMGEGLLMRLDPDFRMINAIGPYVSRSRRLLFSPKFLARQTERNLTVVSKMLMESPERLKRLTSMLESGKLEFSIKYEGEKRLVGDLRKDINRLTLSMLTLGFMVSMALIISAYKPGFFKVEHFLLMSGAIVVAFFGGLMFKIFREGT
ncbi:2-octaprenylphenol hydroxylase [Hydrogenivirga caldilitoris]|uniref:2-octaprenylphenol hydroxylase n=1 Tax=Hydrogenivirga caldilitoris TaxID=246264 RepID=A0A497XRS4_9AQUI|nr:AarF/ABC1/UbiB kinase family protein [Hydrogenivirga caldilitoris]RLJ70860.1 2-octaprenylphenol hydroxylase [Hydrogenivirga caldilitoris]